jgi:hypothetical protein
MASRGKKERKQFRTNDHQFPLLAINNFPHKTLVLCLSFRLLLQLYYRPMTFVLSPFQSTAAIPEASSKCYRIERQQLEAIISVSHYSLWWTSTTTVGNKEVSGLTS